MVKTSDARKIYSQTIAGEVWSAIQITAAAGICAVVDLHATGKLSGQGFVRQEEVTLDDLLANRFGSYYDCQLATRFSQSDNRAQGENDHA